MISTAQLPLVVFHLLGQIMDSVINRNVHFNARRAGLALSIGLVALSSGCATVTRGTKELLVVESDPTGSIVQLSNGMTGTTPTSFKIPRKGDITVTIMREGYETSVVNVGTQVAGAGAAGMAGNVLVGGLIGAGIDAASGAMLEHKPNPVKVTLVPMAPPADRPPNRTVVIPPPDGSHEKETDLETPKTAPATDDENPNPKVESEVSP